MEIIAKGKYIRLSPKKARGIAGVVRGQNAKTAKSLLESMPEKAAKEIAKVVTSAMANAETNFNLDKAELSIARITVDQGPVLKRFQPRAKGAAFHIKKRTSHITVIVSGETQAKKIAKAEKVETQDESREHKIEVERPSFVKKEQAGAKVDLKSKMFRRKTG